MKRKENMPELVYLGLRGVNSRAVAVGLLWFCIIAGIVSAIYVFADPRAYYGLVMLPAAAWYWYAIKWADRNSAWPEK